MFRKILQLFALRCRHSRTSLPFRSDTPDEGRYTDWQPASSNIKTSHYVVCLDCGTKLPYDWDNMKVVASTSAAGAR